MGNGRKSNISRMVPDWGINEMQFSYNYASNHDDYLIR